MSGTEQKPRPSGRGAVTGGLRYRTHEDGEVTILFGGLKRRGPPLTREEILEIEAGEEARDGSP